MTADELRWDDRGLIPAVVQETETGEVLMLAWMDREALDATLRTGSSHFWSRSRQSLWRKGESSGHTQHVDGLYADCDRDTLLVQVHQQGVACHTGARTCFFSRLAGLDGDAIRAEAAGPATLEVLERVLYSRKASPPPGSYVASLFEKGEKQICRKIGEEATEVVTAALGGETDERLVSEVADLWFHSMVLLAGRGIPLRRVFAELARRHAEPKSGR
ncbi:MAG TPA: bifunctional phosphoribosyl-AMP cyclohydrolase/phosphoribosyl-ATP diphosphatase HisIE [Methylomirabilota bacterium]|jgi:phosphoribosyl-ATP pyrophosphohydrolase/phosphoribosyl-AMP cyclohydrolase|nr:bifunctional phosphoribosyl-AMP cyclohydrolase/phosphoribosyl-ATP diphosphatase HisIE [Methylomirabilota bacterium]